MCLTMITRMNVPIFFMISGALLFDGDEELSSVLKKRVIKVVLLLVLFDFVKFPWIIFARLFMVKIIHTLCMILLGVF